MNVEYIKTQLELVDRLQDSSCRLDFQETMTFIFAVAIIIYSISHFLRTLNENKKRK